MSTVLDKSHRFQRFIAGITYAPDEITLTLYYSTSSYPAQPAALASAAGCPSLSLRRLRTGRPLASRPWCRMQKAPLIVGLHAEWLSLADDLRAYFERPALNKSTTR